MNYEALGRHTEAVERIQRLMDERQAAAVQLKSYLDLVQTHYRCGHDIYLFDVRHARQMLDVFVGIEADLVHAVETANAAAKYCGRTPILLAE